METKEFFYDYIDRIEKIDDLLEKPVRSLIGYARTEALTSGPRRAVRLPLYFPPWLASDRKFPASKLSATSALCCATLQRLWWRRRRFPLWQSALAELERELGKHCAKDRLPDQLAEAFLPVDDGSHNGDSYIRFLKDTCLLQRRRPLLACEALWILIHAGEGVSYSGSAFLSFFGAYWALRHRPGPLVAGAAVGLAPPTAYITARCLLPVRELARACARRADLLRRISDILGKIAALEPKQDEFREKLAFKVDDLATAFFDYSDLSLGRDGFETCAADLEKMAGDMSLGDDPAGGWSAVRKRVMEELRNFGRAGRAVVREAAPVVGGERSILGRIVREIRREDGTKLEALGVEMPIPEYSEDADRSSFWQRHLDSAEQAFEVCQTAHQELREACACAAALRSPEVPSLQAVLARMEEANRKVADAILEGIQESIQWCENVMLREIAHSSADNMTEFDPAELVSGLAVSVYAKSIRSPRRLTDAIEKALKGARADGSWTPGRPFLVDEEVGFGEVAPTAGIVWMLSGAVARHRDVRAADAALGRFVEWLEDRQQTVQAGSKEAPLEVVGWASERTRVPRRVDFWTTAFAINSLINIRGLMEFRLWEVCEERFTVLKVKTDLSEIDAVDLGARHRYRLHSRLASMSRRAEGSAWKAADYAVVLHGPPGSSKTVLANAVAKQMWRLSHRVDGIEPRLIRITPADFTRGGEERLDSEARIIFDILSHVRNVTILFDEIDDLLRQRIAAEKPTFLKIVVPAMLNRLQDLRDACPRQQIFFVLATNYVEKIEPALIRKGRIDHALPVVYPDAECRSSMIRKLARGLEGNGRSWAAAVLESALDGPNLHLTRGWPWLTLSSLLKDLETWVRQAPKEDDGDSRQSLEQSLEELMKDYERTIPRSAYNHRLREQRRSAELLSEIRYDALARGEDLEGYLDALRAIRSPRTLRDRLIDEGQKLWERQGRPRPARPRPTTD